MPLAFLGLNTLLLHFPKFARHAIQLFWTVFYAYITSRAFLTHFLQYIVAWPVAKLLETILGPHHGIIYRRGELKELINMHSSVSPHGGDLKHDTVTIIGMVPSSNSVLLFSPPSHTGHTLDLQEKVVRDAMTPIERVFMLPLDTRLDYTTLRKVCESGHSRVPVYEEIDVPVYKNGDANTEGGKVKKIVGILLVKQCVLLDPKGA